MSIIRFAGFNGANQALEPKLLPETVGVVSTNQKPGRGDLRPWNTPGVSLATRTSGNKTIYRMGRTGAQQHSETEFWLSWLQDVHLVMGGNAADTVERTYYTGAGADGLPRWTDLQKATSTVNGVVVVSTDGTSGSRFMGIPAPGGELSLSAASQPVVDLGKFTYLVDQAAIDDLVVGDVLRIKVGDSAAVFVTLGDSGNGKVTLASFLIDFGNIAGIVAASVAEGVRLTSTVVGTSFTIEKKTGTRTVQDYDPAQVGYTDITTGTIHGTDGVAAEFLIDEAWVLAEANGVPTNCAVDSRWTVSVNGSPAVGFTLAAGVGTYPLRVTLETLQSSFASIGGLTATIGLNASSLRQLSIKTVSTGATASIDVKRINPVQTVNDVYSTPASATEIKNTALSENRFYTYTYVTDIGEESAPNPNAKEIVCNTDDIVTISGLSKPAMDYWGITRFRIYRTQDGNASSGFYEVKTIASNLPSTTDTNDRLGGLMATTTWTPAPGIQILSTDATTADPVLTHLTGLWNGMMAGISGRSVRFCEAWTYYAWPITNEVALSNSNPVALATFGQTLVVLTDGNPSIITGGSPESMDEQPVEFYQACMSPRSAVGMGHGVAWVSPDGLAYVGSGGARLLTEGVMTREDWQLLPLTTIIGCMYERRYFGFYGGRYAFVLDPANPQGIYFMDFGVGVNITAVYVDDTNDALYVLDGVNIQRFDAGTAMTVTFKSKVFHQPQPIAPFACAEIVGDFTSASFKLYADGVPKYDTTVTSTTPFRLLGGYRAQDFQIEVSTTGNIQLVAMAHSMAELGTT